MIIETVNKYLTIVAGIKDMINDSPYKTSYLIDQLGMTKQNFYRKLKKEIWSPEEVLTITTILYPQEALMYQLEQSQLDADNGRVLVHKDAMAALRKKFN